MKLMLVHAASNCFGDHFFCHETSNLIFLLFLLTVSENKFIASHYSKRYVYTAANCSSINLLHFTFIKPWSIKYVRMKLANILVEEDNFLAVACSCSVNNTAAVAHIHLVGLVEEGLNNHLVD
jgi:hypothetical protein